jgi:glycosyltransferase involved in cell wall biosynthesis
MTSLGARDVRVLPAVAIPDNELSCLDSTSVDPSDSRTRFVSIGRLEHWKGFELGLRAFAEANLEGCDLRVVGDGPERGRLTALAVSLGLANSVEFVGEVGRGEVFEILSQSDVLVHPSFHDSGGWVCLEAMAAGLPVVCLDLAGPAVLVSETAGVKVAAETPRQVIERLAVIMRELAAHNGQRARLGASARRHVASEHTWARRAEQVAALYEGILERHSTGASC